MNSRSHGKISGGELWVRGCGRNALVAPRRPAVGQTPLVHGKPRCTRHALPTRWTWRPGIEPCHSPRPLRINVKLDIAEGKVADVVLVRRSGSGHRGDTFGHGKVGLRCGPRRGRLAPCLR